MWIWICICSAACKHGKGRNKRRGNGTWRNARALPPPARPPGGPLDAAIVSPCLAAPPSGMDRRPAQPLLQALVDLVQELSTIVDHVTSYRKECVNLLRRAKLLAPLFEELRDSGAALPATAVSSLRALEATLKRSKLLLEECRDGSRFVLVMDRDIFAVRFRTLTADLSRALDGLPLDLLDVSDEVHEQVELLHAQLKRAKGRVDSQDEQLYVAVKNILKREGEPAAVLDSIVDKLHLRSESAWRHELGALEAKKKRIGSERGCWTHEEIDRIVRVVKRIHWVPSTDEYDDGVFPGWRDKPSSSKGFHARNGVPNPPDDFKCPISLELLKDPVIVATGQTYERACIQKWLEEGNRTCPKTQQTLSHLVLTPNYVLRSLIAQWCESNGLEPPKRSGNDKGGKNCGKGGDFVVSGGDQTLVESLLQKLKSPQPEVQRAAAGELRLLAKVSTENRVCIGKCGAIPVLVSVLSAQDLKAQEHAVTALLNLSIHEGNKRAIVSANAINPIVEVLKHGSIEARENAAATLFSLSAVQESKATIGASGAIPALVELLKDGNSRGKKDAATALFSLCIYPDNKAIAVKAGIVAPLLELLVDASIGMVDESLAILSVLATHSEARTAISRACPTAVLVDLISGGSSKNKENGAAVLLQLCRASSHHITAGLKLGAAACLEELSQTGTSRARRKATELLQLLNEQETVSIGCGKVR